MMDLKKRALILTLAATVSVTGSFAADNYKNCLMNMKFEPVNDKEITLVLNTKTNYSGSVTPMRKNASTFIIILSETDTQAVSPDLTKVGGVIESVEISKMPYSNGSKGYTKITVKTSGVINLNTTTALYMPTAEEIKAIEKRKAEEERKAKEQNTVKSAAPAATVSKSASKQIQSTPKKAVQSSQNRTTERSSQSQRAATTMTKPETISKDIQQDNLEESNSEKTPQIPTANESSNQKYMLGLLALLIVMISAVIYIKGRENMNNVMGENLEINLKDEDENNSDKKTQKKKRKSISRTINKLDYTYKNQYKHNDNSEYTQAPKQPESEPEEEMNIVDLDALFKEKQSVEAEDTTSALDDFLSGFSFDAEEEEQQQNSETESALGFDEEIYESLLNDPDIKFSKEDIECFNELLQSEISDEVVKNIDKYAVSNPIKHKKRSIDKILERLVTDYTISQNITFTKEDVDILRKLISVEIDSDFVKDLRTNPQLTKKMEREISSGGTRKKPSEILTLNVKDMLPNLSDELKKQGKRPIRSEAQPEVVYYSEGYDVDKLVLDFDLPDLSKELKNKKAYIAKPSDPGVTVDKSYTNTVQKLKTTGLPDLKDVMAHPNKYAEPKKKRYVPDEKALLNNLQNVQFKPFDDGTRKFEVINDIEEDPQIEANSLSAEDIEKEFRQFDNFEVAKQEEFGNNYTPSDYDDFEELYKQDFVDLDKNLNEDKSVSGVSNDLRGTVDEPKYEQENLAKELDIPRIRVGGLSDNKKSLLKKNEKQSEKNTVKNSVKKINIVNKAKNQENFEKLVNIFEKWKSDNKNQYENREKVKVIRQSDDKAQPLVKCIMDGVSYDVITSAAINEQIGCHLVKSEKGYMVLSYKGSELSVIKEYPELKKESLQIRLSEMLDDGTPRYLIKVGLNKFIADIADGQVRYVMDLC